MYTYGYFMLMYDKSNQYYKVIILQLKINQLKKKKRNRFELGRRALELSFNPTGQPRGDSASLNPASVLGQGGKRGLSEFSVPLPHHFWPELPYTQPFLVRRVQQKCWLGDKVFLLQKKLGRQQMVASASLTRMLGSRQEGPHRKLKFRGTGELFEAWG